MSDPLDGPPETAEVDEALLDLKCMMSNFLIGTASGGQTWELREQLDDLSGAVIDAHQAAGETDTYQGWAVTDITVAPDN